MKPMFLLSLCALVIFGGPVAVLRLQGARRLKVLEAAWAKAQAALLDQRCSQEPSLQVSAMLWYGAVDISADYATFWVLLRSSELDLASQLPPWLMLPRDGGDDPHPAPPEHILCWLHELHAIFASTMLAQGWPGPTRLGFEAESRVSAAHPRHYFQ